MPKTSSLLVVIILVGSGCYVLSNASAVRASTIVVPSDYLTIQSAIDHAKDGDTIFVRSGTYHENIIVNKPLIVVGESRLTTIIDGGQFGHVVTMTAKNVTLSGFKIVNGSYSGAGIFLNSTCNSRIFDNAITDNSYGVNFAQASFNSLFDNEIERSLHSGVAFKFDAGIEGESENQIYRNNIHDNQVGIYFDGIAYNNTICGNNLVNNAIGIGLFFWGNGKNTFIRNNIVATQHCVLIFDSGENKWDDDYPLGGNYWGDYPGIDRYHGVHQNETGSDGIGDFPYYMDQGNVDHYPLMVPLVIPEFPSFDILPLFMMTTLLTIIRYRKKMQ